MSDPHNDIHHHPTDPKHVERKTPKDRRISWCTVNTMEDIINADLVHWLGLEEVKARSFRNMLRPLVFKEERIYKPLAKFCTNMAEYIPRVKDDSSRNQFQSICALLSSKSSVRLYGLLSHFCYWNILHPCIRSTVTRFQEDVDVTHISHDEHMDDISAFVHDYLSVEEPDADPAPTTSVKSVDAGYEAIMDEERHKGEIRPMIYNRGNAFKGVVPSSLQSSSKAMAVDSDARTVEVDGGAAVAAMHADGLTVGSIASYGTDTSLSASEKEVLFLQLEECLLAIHKSVSIS